MLCRRDRGIESSSLDRLAPVLGLPVIAPAATRRAHEDRGTAGILGSVTDSEPRSSAPGDDRRGSEDRRKQNSGAPDGIERRKGERRKGHPDTAIEDADWENEGGATESGSV